MGNALTYKSKSEQTSSMAFGIVLIAVLTIVCYIVGYIASQSDSFVERTLIHLIFKKHGFRYFSAAFSMIVPICIYVWQFTQKAGRNTTQYSFIKVDGGNAPYVYNGWTLWAVLSGVITLVVGFLIHCIAFKWQLDLVKPLMIWVLILQSVLSGAVFMLPFCKPLKNA